MEIVRLKQLPLNELRPLLIESQEQGFEFLQRFVDEFNEGVNRFARPGEALFAMYEGAQMIGIGGLTQDPYTENEEVGRVRRLYVLSTWRRRGVGRQLVERIIEEARPHYRLLTLRTLREEASRFYCRLGFQTEPKIANTTHHLYLNEKNI